MIGIEPKIIQCAPANSIRVLILSECFAAPAHVASRLVRCPGRITETCVPLCSIVEKARMIQGRVKPQVTHSNSTSQRHTERLNRAIEVLIINSVLIMVHSRDWARYLVSDKSAPIDSWRRFNWTDGSTSPRVDGNRHSHGGTYRCKSEACRAAYAILKVGRIVVHVAFSRMSMAPGVLNRTDVLNLGVIRRAWI